MSHQENLIILLWELPWVLLFLSHLFPKTWRKDVVLTKKWQLLLVSKSLIKLQNATTAVQTRKILVCSGPPSPCFRVTVNKTHVAAGHLNGQPFVLFSHSCTSCQHGSLLPQSAGPWVWFCLARPLAKLWESKHRWTCADKITNYRNGCPNGCNKFQRETNSLRFYWLLMLLLPALVLLFDSSHILLSPKGLFGPSALINMLPWEGACFK